MNEGIFYNFILKYFRKSFLWFVECPKNSLLNEPYLVGDMFEEVSVMRYDKTRPVEVLEHILDDILGMEIQMVRWFIHDDDVRFREKHLGECHLGTFSS